MFVWFAVLSDPHPHGLLSTCALPCMQSFFYFYSVFLEIRTLHHWNQHFSPGSSSLLGSHVPAHPVQPLLRSLLTKSWRPSTGQWKNVSENLSHFLLHSSSCDLLSCHLLPFQALTQITQPGFLRPAGNAIKQRFTLWTSYRYLWRYLAWVKGGKVTGNKARSCKPHFKLNLPDQ